MVNGVSYALQIPEKLLENIGATSVFVNHQKYVELVRKSFHLCFCFFVF